MGYKCKWVISVVSTNFRWWEERAEPKVGA